MNDELLNAPLIICGCCGDLIPDTSEHNIFYGMESNPADEGYGMCLGCLDWAETIIRKTQSA
ncbi:MAG: hypothetical protein JST85_30545 [Acidobacteria bacterium]|nr:hypothetical protein [Acidobacteriota bacterium]